MAAAPVTTEQAVISLISNRWADEADGQIDNEAKWDAASSPVGIQEMLRISVL
ncbi:MAG: hypothetical protein R3C26_22440 [Calditrichia bacterium]